MDDEARIQISAAPGKAGDRQTDTPSSQPQSEANEALGAKSVDGQRVPVEQAKLPALRDTPVGQIISRYLSDESTKDIAASFGVTRQALGQYLLKAAESDWKEAQVARALARKEAADDDLEAIGEQIKKADREERERLTLSLAHARERLRSAQWDLERVCRRIYGQDVPQVSQAVQININLRRGADKAAPEDAQVIEVKEERD